MAAGEPWEMARQVRFGWDVERARRAWKVFWATGDLECWECVLVYFMESKGVADADTDKAWGETRKSKTGAFQTYKHNRHIEGIRRLPSGPHQAPICLLGPAALDRQRRDRTARLGLVAGRGLARTGR